MRFEERAQALLGTRFRPQGRTAEGLDCAGLVVMTYGISDPAARCDYRLSGDHHAELRAILDRHFRPVRGARAGDLVLFAVAADQLHLAVKSATGIIHADAALRRIVERPGNPPWPVQGVYRRRKAKA